MLHPRMARDQRPQGAHGAGRGVCEGGRAMTSLAIAWCIIGVVTFLGFVLEAIFMTRARFARSDIWALPALLALSAVAGVLLYAFWQIMQKRNDVVTWTIEPHQISSLNDVGEAYMAVSDWIEKTKDYTYPKGSMA